MDIGRITRCDHGLIARGRREDEHFAMDQVEDRAQVDPRRPTRVLIVDDSAQIRRGLTDLFALADDIEVIAEAADGVEAVALAPQLMPDVVVMDLAMPLMDGIQATRLIRAAQPAVRVLTLTALCGQEQVAREAGADCLVLKDADPEAIIGAVRSLA